MFFFFFFYYNYYDLRSKSTVAGGIDCLVILYLHASSDCLESRMLFFQGSHGFYFFTSASCRLGSETTHDSHSGRHVVYLSKTYFLSKSTGNTREAVSRTT